MASSDEYRMHKPTERELAHARGLVERLHAAADCMRIGSYEWDSYVLAAGYIEGWLSCADSRGEVRNTLRRTLESAMSAHFSGATKAPEWFRHETKHEVVAISP